MKILYILVFLIVVQSKSQDLEWAKSIGSSGEDVPSSIILDATGNVYIAGRFSGTVDFDPNASTTNLTSAGSVDGFFAKYTSEGNLVWAKNIGGIGNDDIREIEVDASGNIYVSGRFGSTADFDPDAGVFNLTSAGGNDVFFAKYTSNGSLIWAKSIGSTGDDRVRGSILDASGNLYISGHFNGTVDFDPDAGTTNLTSAGGADTFFAKYASDGSLIWAKGVGGTSNDESYSITLDNSGNIYIAGEFSGTADFDPDAGTTNIISAGGTDAFFAKYDNNGALLWAKNVGGISNDRANSIAVNTSGVVYLTGYFIGTADLNPDAGTTNLSSAGGQDIFFAKYATDGSLIWANGIGGTDNDRGVSIALDNSGDLYITGSFQLTVDFDPSSATTNLISNGAPDVFFAKYRSNGTLVWAKNVGGSLGDYGNSITLDAVGYLYVTGDFRNTVDFNPGAGTTNLTSLGVNDIFFAKYSQNSNSQTDNSNLPNNGDGNGDGVVDSNQDNVNTILDAYGNSYITVFVTDGYALNDVFVSLPDDENNYIYPYGNVEFKINASQSEVKIYYHGIASLNGYTYRKLLPNNTYGQFDNVIFSTETINGNEVAVATLTLVDGGAGDYDGIVNGVIYDPGGPALPVSANIPFWDWWYSLLLIPTLIYGYKKFS